MEQLTRVVCAVYLKDDNEAQLWFQVLHDAYRMPDEQAVADWGEFIVRLAIVAAEAGLAAALVEQFAQNLLNPPHASLATQDPLADVLAVRQLWQASSSEVLAAYRELATVYDEREVFGRLRSVVEP
jgi:hypothetical protein